MLATLSTPTREQKQAALDDALQSQTFARSEQLRSFLKFICEKEIAGQGKEINEYLIGIEVMRRPADYSPNEDGAVRNRAYALRNKLQEFYAHEKADAQVRIELPKGSYCPHFSKSEWLTESSAMYATSSVLSLPSAESMLVTEAPFSAPAALEPVASKVRPRWYWYMGLVLLAGFVVAFFSWGRPRKSALGEFWEPVLDSRNAALICATQPVVYQLDGQARENLVKRQSSLTSDQPLTHDPESNEQLKGSDVVAITDQYTGIGTAYATAQITALLQELDKQTQIKFGNETSFADLRKSPAVLIGAFGNRWTMSIANHFRFVFEGKNIRQRYIVDKANPNNRWGFDDKPITGKVSEDYAIISRVFQSETGEMLIMAAGITQYGTRAAGEFLTNSTYLEQFAREAPAGWQKKNLQIVFSVKIIDNTPGPPTVLATHFW